MDLRRASSRVFLTRGRNETTPWATALMAASPPELQDDVTAIHPQLPQKKVLTRLAANGPVVPLRGTKVAHIMRDRLSRAARMVTPIPPSLAGNPSSTDTSGNHRHRVLSGAAWHDPPGAPGPGYRYCTDSCTEDEPFRAWTSSQDGSPGSRIRTSPNTSSHELPPSYSSTPCGLTTPSPRSSGSPTPST